MPPDWIEHHEYTNARWAYDYNRNRLALGISITHVDCLSFYLVRIYLGPWRFWWRTERKA
jgi:hypothetical protein